MAQTEATLLAFAKSYCINAYNQVYAKDNTSPGTIVQMTLIETGFVNGTGDPDAASVSSGDVSQIVFRIAYGLIMAAMDIVRSKISEAEATPAKVKFREEYKYLEMLLKRFAAKANITDTGIYTPDAPFDFDKVDLIEY